jgi:hypothetical protein
MTHNVTKIRSTKREKAACLVADDRLSDEKIAEQCEVTRRTIVRWKEQPRFAARLKAISESVRCACK